MRFLALPRFVVSSFVVAGCCASGVSNAQTATLAPTTWVQQSPSTSPTARGYSAMAYDAAAGQVVLFGGYTGVGFLNDTWTYNGTTWTQQSPASSPSARYGAATAYDAATGQIVLFGGYNGSYLNDTWTYNGATWTQQGPAMIPSARNGSMMAYDAATGRIVLFGGINSSGTLLNDTWTYNGTTWTQQSPATSPSARDFSAMAYDAVTGQIVLFGGFIGTASLADTWTYNGTTWTQQSLSSSPSARASSTMAYDAVTGQIVLFGGAFNGTLLNDTWTYNGTTWTQQSPSTNPSIRSVATMAYDAATGQIILFGGYSGSYLNDTWTLQLGTNIGTANVCSGGTPTPCSTTQTLTYTFSGTSGTIKAPAVLTQGAAGLDFTDAGTGTCTTNGTSHTYNSGDTCTVVVTFTPKAPGLRRGAVKLLNSSGALIVSTPVSGTGTGPLALLSGAQGTTYSTTLNNPRGLTVDASGNLYVSNQNSDTVLKFTSGGTQSTLTTAAAATTGTAVDGAGNVYYGAGSSVYELAGGVAGTGVSVGTLPSSDLVDNNLSVDGAGNLYTSGQSKGAIYGIAAGSGTVTTLVAGVTGRRFMGMALDSNGNLFAADYNNNILYELPAGAGALTTVFSSAVLHNPQGLAVDAADNVYFCSTIANTVDRYAADGSSVTLLLAAGEGGLAIGPTGNLYTAYGNNLYTFTRNSTGVGFGSTAVGTTLSNGGVLLENDGNAPLAIASIASSTTNFTLVGAIESGVGALGSQVPACGATLASSAICGMAVAFTPQTEGSFTGSGIVTDNSLYATGSTQTIAFSNATGTAGTTTFGAMSFSPTANEGQGTSQIITISDTVTYGGTRPTGAVQFVLNGVPHTATCTTTGSPETCTFAVPAATIAALAVNTYTVTVAQASDSNYNAATGTSGTFTVGTSYIAPTEPVGTASATQTVNVKITKAGTTSGTLSTAIQVLTMGATGLDYAYVAGGTCAVSTAYTVGNVCTVQYTFTPRAPGTRMGAIVLYSGTAVLGTTYISGTATGPLGVISPGKLSTVAGNGTVCDFSTDTCGDSGSATSVSANLNGPEGVVVDGAGNFYIADRFDNRIRIVCTVATGYFCTGASVGSINTVVGTGTQCSGGTGTICGDGASTYSSNLSGPNGIAVDGAGNLYIADTFDHRIRMVTAATHIISTVAGSGTICGDTFGDGASGATCGDGGLATAAGAELDYPYGVAVDGAGNLYIADTQDNSIRMVAAATGILSTLAGNGGAPCGGAGGASCGDGGLATVAAAELYYPTGVAVDGAGSLYIADAGDQSIRKVTAATGYLSTVAGNGGQNCSATTAACGDGGLATAAAAYLYSPYGVAVDAAGNLYIADTSDNRIRKVTAATGILSTVAASGTQCSTSTATCGDTGSATATAADMHNPEGVAVDGAGNLYIADTNDNRIRKVTATASTLSFASTAVGASSAQQVVTLSNNGNTTALTLSSLSTGSSNANFSGAGTTCSTASPVAAGATCNLGVVFAPASVGNPLTGSGVVTDNSLNSSSSTQAVPVSGVSTIGSATFGTMSFSPAATEPQGTSQIVTISDTVTYPGVQPTGAVKFVLNSVTYTATCTSTGSPETCTFAVPAATIAALAVNSYTVTAALTADSNYNAASGANGTFTIVQVAQTISFTQPVTPAFIKTAATLSATGGASGNPVTFSIISGTATLSGTNNSTITYTTLGSVTIAANQLGNSSYAAATQVTRTVTVGKQSVFIANSGGSVTTAYDSGGSQSTATSGGGIGAAVDAVGNVWSINANGSGVSLFTDAGAFSTSYSGSGISSAKALAIDGNNITWIANGNGTVSALTNAGANALTTPIDPMNGTAAPSSISVDTAGSLWLAIPNTTTPSSSTVIEVIGGAGPISTPIVMQVINSSTGTKP